LPALFVQGGSSLEKINLAFISRGAVKDADGSLSLRELAYIAFYGFIAVAEPILFDEILPDTLNGKPSIQFVYDRVAVKRGR